MELMDTSSDEDILILACILSEEEKYGKKKKNKKKRIWVKPDNQDRDVFGENHRRFLKLKDDEESFFQYFRMSYNKFSELLNILEPALTYQNTNFRMSISKEERLAVTLRFLATGDKFRTISRSYHMGLTTVRGIVYATCEAIWEMLAKIVMPMPTKEKWRAIEEKFSTLYNFPNCLAAIDGKHVLTDRAPEDESLSFSHRKSFSTVLLAMIDADSKFIAVDIGAYGKNNNGGVFSSSVLGKNMLKNQMDFPEDKILPGTDLVLPHVCVGSESFLPLHRHLLRIYPRNKASVNEDMKIFNQRLSNVKQVSDNVFDMLVKRFHIYRKHLKIGPEKMDRVILATCCLHNFLADDVCFWTESDNFPNPQAFKPISGIGGSSSRTAISVRNEFKKYFSSPIGNG